MDPNVKNDIKHTIKQTIKRLYNGIHDASQFEKIISDVTILVTSTYKNLNEQLVKKLVSKYSHIHLNYLIIDTKNPTYNLYQDIVKNISDIKLTIKPCKKTHPIYGPYSDTWIHDIQVDDDVSSKELQRRINIFRYLENVEYPAQRSPEWYAARDKKITASDIGLCLGDDHYNEPYYAILKKMRETFANNPNTYHGKKMEEIATIIYEYRMNVTCNEFGLCNHPKYSFLGASPDGIVSEYKNDGIHKTNIVGRMLEIKCPPRRQIKTSGKVRGDICPTYYWDQVQIQLETCDLDECDFWQCNIKEYANEKEFNSDTLSSEPFRSQKTGFEKGVLIQLLPLDKPFDKTHSDFDEEVYNMAVYSSATFIHPTKVEMTPDDCKEWIKLTIEKIPETHPGCYLDKVVYWYLNNSHNVLIPRDRNWFKESIPKLQKMWDRVCFLRAKPEVKQLLLDYHDYFHPELNEYINEYKFPNLIKQRHDKGHLILHMIDELMEVENNEKEYNKLVKKFNKQIEPMRTTKL
jgi:putative phage-type endonuclease